MRALWADSDWAEKDEAIVPEANAARVVDSFLLEGGTVRSIDKHWERFTEANRLLGLASGQRLECFLQAVNIWLPGAGRWFPRVEAHLGDPAPLVCWLRPAPSLTESVRLWVSPEPDPRTCPEIKGPDHVLLAGLREQAVHHGADDAALGTRDGQVIEAAHSALLWWRDDTLCHPAENVSVLPSVTAERIREAAIAEGFAVKADRCTWQEIATCEVWAVNALHGIRPVTSWLHTGSAASEHEIPQQEITAPAPNTARAHRFRELVSPTTALRAGPSWANHPPEGVPCERS